MYYSNQVNNKAFSQKKFFLETQNRLFSPHHQTTLSQSLNREPTSLVLAKYKLVVLRPLCACSIIFCCCLLLFPQCFYRCKLVLFHPATYLFCPCLFLWKRVWALGLALFSFVFFPILFPFSFTFFLPLALSYFFIHFLLCLSFPFI